MFYYNLIYVTHCIIYKNLQFIQRSIQGKAQNYEKSSCFEKSRDG